MMDNKVFWIVKAVIESAAEEEWNHWYNSVHVPEVMACPGFLSARRVVAEEEGQRTYIAIYELEDESAATSDAFNNIRGWGEFSDQVQSESKLYRTILAL